MGGGLYMGFKLQRFLGLAPQWAHSQQHGVELAFRPSWRAGS